MKEKLLSREDIKRYIPAFRSRIGNLLVRPAMRLFGINKANRFYDSSKCYEGAEFCRHALDDAGVRLQVEGVDILEQFSGKPFITVANHPYGHIDALAVLSVIASERPDYKVTANFILELIDTLSMHFISLNPYQRDTSNMESIRSVLSYIEDGHPVGFFPAGAVSDPKLTLKGFRVKDRDWKLSTVKLIRKAGVPVIPIYISGQNSWIYNLLGLISWKLRTIRLPHELGNKKGKAVRVIFGQPITPEQIAGQATAKDLAEFLRQSCYALDKRNRR